jgi:HEAT repeat protein
MHQFSLWLASSLLVAAGIAPTVAQEPMMPSAAVPAPEASAIAEGWTFLAQGRYEDAAKATAALLTRFPRNPAALSLGVEVEVARHGADRALARYEGWLAGRTLEEPGVLRRVARAFLHEWARQTSDAAVRIAALKALAEDGDPHAPGVLAAITPPPGAAAVAGDRAVPDLAARLAAAPGLKLREIARLAETGSARAVAPLIPVLRDPQPENRAAAAEALGTLGGPEALAALKPLLNDPHGVVKVAAAGALFKHGDFSGAPVLQELAASEHATMRRSAAILMASQPDESWKSLVRGLANDPDPSIQLDAARLLVPHDPDAARAIFSRLLDHADLAIREEAASAASDTTDSDFAMLRRLLHASSGKVKVRAASRVLHLTR